MGYLDEGYCVKWAAGSVAPRPPMNISLWANEELDKLGESFERVVAALDIADEAYHTITDTPMKELQADSEEIGDLVTRARDEWRHVTSYNLDFSKLPDAIDLDEVAWPGTDKVVFVPLIGHKLQVTLSRTWIANGEPSGDEIYWSLASSRGKFVAFIDCSTCDDVGPDLGVTRPDAVFSQLLRGDELSIPDLIVDLKR